LSDSACPVRRGVHTTQTEQAEAGRRPAVKLRPGSGDIVVLILADGRLGIKPPPVPASRGSVVGPPSKPGPPAPPPSPEWSSARIAPSTSCAAGSSCKRRSTEPGPLHGSPTSY